MRRSFLYEEVVDIVGLESFIDLESLNESLSVIINESLNVILNESLSVIVVRSNDSWRDIVWCQI